MSDRKSEGLERAYEILHLGDQASLDEVKRAYSTLIRIEGRWEDNWVRLKELDWAYEVLSEHLFDPPDGTRPQGGEGEGSKPVPERPDLPERAAACLFPPDEDAGSIAFLGRALLSVVLAVWGLMFVLSPMSGDYVGRSFMHLINLPFHEAGHVLFSILGDFLRVLGGTLTQVLIPLICVAAFIRKGDVFGAACALWWTGQSLIDIAPYIYDARAGELMLLGGVTGQEAPEFHDWHNILGRLGLLSWDHFIAYGSKATGAFLMIASCAWSGWYLLRHRRNLGGGGV